jgi:hypothetical protein
MVIVEHCEFAPFDNLVQPAWWSGTAPIDPAEVTIDCSESATDARDIQHDSQLGRRMREVYDEVDMRSAAQLIIDTEMPDDDGGANPRDNIAPNVDEIGAPLAAWLHDHHEMADVGRSTRVISFLVKDVLPQPGPNDRGVSRGATFVSDSIGATDRLLGTEFGVYNHWQKSFETDDPNVLYSSLADRGMWFDTWPLVQHLPDEQRPLHMTFGDDSKISPEKI